MYVLFQSTFRLAIILGALAGVFLVLTVIFAALYGTERNKNKSDTGMHSNRFWRLFYFVYFSATSDSDICLTPYCVKAG